MKNERALWGGRVLLPRSLFRRVYVHDHRRHRLLSVLVHAGRERFDTRRT